MSSDQNNLLCVTPREIRIFDFPAAFVFIEGRLCPYLEVVEIVQAGRPDFGVARMMYNPAGDSEHRKLTVEEIENEVGIGKGVSIGARTLIGENKTIPPRSLVMGSPGRVVRELTDEEVLRLRQTAQSYRERSGRYAVGLVAVTP